MGRTALAQCADAALIALGPRVQRQHHASGVSNRKGAVVLFDCLSPITGADRYRSRLCYSLARRCRRGKGVRGLGEGRRR